VIQTLTKENFDLKMKWKNNKLFLRQVIRKLY
jgi:hypothetical protein